MRSRRTPVLTARTSGLLAVTGVLLLVVLVGIAWRATSAAWFLVFPLLLLGVFVAAAAAALWILRHF